MPLALPLFPLNTVLYPGGLLPLKIFEQRYLDMTKACLRDGSPFGVCRIREGQEVGAPALPDEVGCTAIIAQWEMPHLGVFHLQSRGRQAFRILGQAVQPDGLIRAEVELLDDAPGHCDDDALQLCLRMLEQILARLGTDHLFPPLEFGNPRWIGYRLAEVLPLGLADKQALLEIRDDGARLARLVDFFRSVG